MSIPWGSRGSSINPAPGTAWAPMATFCGSAGAAGGFFVGWLFGRDQAPAPRDIPWYGIAGLLLGAFLGLLASLPPAAVLTGLQGRAWAPVSVRISSTALAAAAPIVLYVTVASGFEPALEAVVFCVAVTAVPAVLATAWLAARAGHAKRRARPAA